MAYNSMNNDTSYLVIYFLKPAFPVSMIFKVYWQMSATSRGRVKTQNKP